MLTLIADIHTDSHEGHKPRVWARADLCLCSADATQAT